MKKALFGGIEYQQLQYLLLIAICRQFAVFYQFHLLPGAGIVPGMVGRRWFSEEMEIDFGELYVPFSYGFISSVWYQPAV